MQLKVIWTALIASNLPCLLVLVLLTASCEKKNIETEHRPVPNVGNIVFRPYIAPPESSPTLFLILERDSTSVNDLHGTLVYAEWGNNDETTVDRTSESEVEWPEAVRIESLEDLWFAFRNVARPDALELRVYLEVGADGIPTVDPVYICVLFWQPPNHETCRLHEDQESESGTTWKAAVPVDLKGNLYMTLWASWPYIPTTNLAVESVEKKSAAWIIAASIK
jgi:hypothetical protein